MSIRLQRDAFETGSAGYDLAIGTQSSTTASDLTDGMNLNRTTKTKSFGVYADDGAAVLWGTGSVPDIKSGISRLFISTDQTGGHVRLFGFQGMLASYTAKWNTEIAAGVEGVAQLVCPSTKTFGGYGVTAGLAGRLATGAGTVVCNTNHIMAAVAAISDLKGTVTQTGKVCGVYIGKYDTTNWSDGTTRNTPGYGLIIGAGAATTGILMSSVSYGINSTVTVYPAAQWGDSAHLFKVSAAAARNENGAAGYFETDVTATVAGTLYGMGSWVNFNAAVTTGANMVCAQDNGIYGVAAGTYTNTKMIIGMRMELVSDSSGGCAPGSLYLFSTNIYGRECTALIDVNDKSEVGWITGTLSSGGCHIPLFKERGTTTFYVNCYTS